MIPFSWLIEYSDMPEKVSSSLSYHVEQLAVTLAGSEAVEVKAILSFDVFLRRLMPVEMITNVRMEPLSMEELSEQPGIVRAYCAKWRRSVGSCEKIYDNY